jgi:hypothetical protein
MSQTLLYRQYWLATLKNRHICASCGAVATIASYSENEDGCAINVSWFCESHVYVIIGL